jgi:D-alanyl-D-alanine carboxypeptidase
MISDAKSDGVDLLICYGYRTLEQADQLFKKQLGVQLAKGLPYDEAVTEAKKWVAMPGYSEHHTGLALDIVTPAYQVLNAGFAQTDAAVWMAQNAYRYGFIIRYPADKVDVTGIGYEPWHVRYVGKANAKAIFEQGLCLEEYLEKTGPKPS